MCFYHPNSSLWFLAGTRIQLSLLTTLGGRRITRGSYCSMHVDFWCANLPFILKTYILMHHSWYTLGSQLSLRFHAPLSTFTPLPRHSIRPIDTGRAHFHLRTSHPFASLSSVCLRRDGFRHGRTIRRGFRSDWRHFRLRVVVSNPQSGSRQARRCIRASTDMAQRSYEGDG